MRFYVYCGWYIVAILGIVTLCLFISRLCGYELEGNAIRSLFVLSTVVVTLLASWLTDRKKWQAIVEERRKIYGDEQ